MQAVPLLQHVIVELAQRHDVGLHHTGAYLRLQLEGHGHLVIENIGTNRLSVTNYIQVGNELAADPEVVFFINDQPSKRAECDWIPLEITQVFGGWTLYAE